MNTSLSRASSVASNRSDRKRPSEKELAEPEKKKKVWDKQKELDDLERTYKDFVDAIMKSHEDYEYANNILDPILDKLETKFVNSGKKTASAEWGETQKNFLTTYWSDNERFPKWTEEEKKKGNKGKLVTFETLGNDMWNQWVRFEKFLEVVFRNFGIDIDVTRLPEGKHDYHERVVNLLSSSPVKKHFDLLCYMVFDKMKKARNAAKHGWKWKAGENIVNNYLLVKDIMETARDEKSDHPRPVLHNDARQGAAAAKEATIKAINERAKAEGK